MSEATMSREDEIKARLEKATKGPWYWNVNPKHKQIELRNGGNIVMDFIRWGMGGAMPRFNIRGLMRKASELTSNWPGRDHHASWAQQLSNPDAVFIAHAREDVPYLLDRVAMFEKLYSHAIECVDKVFQDCSKHEAMLPDFLKLGESKFNGVVTLAEKYKALLAENARLRAENLEYAEKLLKHITPTAEEFDAYIDRQEKETP